MIALTTAGPSRRFAAAPLWSKTRCRFDSLMPPMQTVDVVYPASAIASRTLRTPAVPMISLVFVLLRKVMSVCQRRIRDKHKSLTLVWRRRCQCPDSQRRPRKP